MRGIERYNPIAVTVYFLTVTIPAMLCMDPVLIACSFAGAMLLYVMVNSTSGLKMHVYALLLFAFMALMNPLISHKGATVLFVLNDNPVTLEAFWYGLTAAGMILSVMYWFRLYTQMMTSDKLLYVFGGISPKSALMLSMTLRYVPMFVQQTKKVSQAQKAMGLYREDNIIDSIKGGLRVFSVMVTWTLENGIITADSMTARGYGTGKRSRFSLFSWRTEDVMLIFASLLLLSVTLYGKRTVVFYPWLELEACSLRVMMGYIAYALLVITPTMIEGKEKIKWHWLTSRI